MVVVQDLLFLFKVSNCAMQSSPCVCSLSLIISVNGPSVE